MTANGRLFLKSVIIACLVEVGVLGLTLFPMLECVMTKNAVAATQAPFWKLLLGWFGVFFHYPALLLTFWFVPLFPFVQIFILSGLIYSWYKLTKGVSYGELRKTA